MTQKNLTTLLIEILQNINDEIYDENTLKTLIFILENFKDHNDKTIDVNNIMKYIITGWHIHNNLTL